MLISLPFFLVVTVRKNSCIQVFFIEGNKLTNSSADIISMKVLFLVLFARAQIKIFCYHEPMYRTIFFYNIVAIHATL